MIRFLPLLLLAGCASIKENPWPWVGAVVIAGAVISQDSGKPKTDDPSCHAIEPPGTVKERLC